MLTKNLQFITPLMLLLLLVGCGGGGSDASANPPAASSSAAALNPQPEPTPEPAPVLITELPGHNDELWADAVSAARLLQQTTFGATQDSLLEVLNKGESAWLQEQLNAAPTLHRRCSISALSPSAGRPHQSPS